MIINCIEAQVWSEEHYALSVCECLPSLKLINCRNRGLYELDLPNLPAAYFANVRILDLRANKLRDLPASNLVHYVFPDLKIIQLADNINLSCLQINNWKRFLQPYATVVTDSSACDTTTTMAALPMTAPNRSLNCKIYFTRPSPFYLNARLSTVFRLD